MRVVHISTLRDLQTVWKVSPPLSPNNSTTITESKVESAGWKDCHLVSKLEPKALVSGI
jgi:hypothetical protein